MKSLGRKCSQCQHVELVQGISENTAQSIQIKWCYCFVRVHFCLCSDFSSVTSKIQSMYDDRLCQLKEVLAFFHDWESEYSGPKLHTKHLITTETCEDIDSSIYNFMHLAKVGCDINVPVAPGYIYSDLIENWFGQIRSLCIGANHNPTLKQIIPSINSNIITGSVI